MTDQPPLLRAKRCETCHWCDETQVRHMPHIGVMRFDRVVRDRELRHPGWWRLSFKCRAMAPLHTFDVQALDWCGQWTQRDNADRARRTAIDADMEAKTAAALAYDTETERVEEERRAEMERRDAAEALDRTLGILPPETEESAWRRSLRRIGL